MPDDLHELSALYGHSTCWTLPSGRASRSTWPTAIAARPILAGLRTAATALAFVERPAAAGRAPFAHPDRRTRRASNVVSLSSRRSTATSAAVAFAVAASAAAVGFGIWAATLHHSLTDERAATSVASRSALAATSTCRGRRASSWSRRPAMLCSPFHFRRRRRARRTRRGVASPAVHPAGVFSGGLVKLSRSVPHGALVMVTLERHGGTSEPTQQPLLRARA